MNNQKILTASFIIIGLSLIGINFLIARGVSKNLEASLSNLPQITKDLAKARILLPDIKPGESITKSAIRDAEIKKVKNSLPYTESKFTLNYDATTKYLTANIHATSIEGYRANKLLAEQKLVIFGAADLCKLAIIWEVPVELSRQVTKSDLTTNTCQ